MSKSWLNKTREVKTIEAEILFTYIHTCDPLEFVFHQTPIHILTCIHYFPTGEPITGDEGLSRSEYISGWYDVHHHLKRNIILSTI
jgi:hypothetical protein